jgi:xylitol oxidase
VTTNWAQNVIFGARELRAPETVDELQNLVSRNDKVRVLGAGHSFNRIADTTGLLVSLERMPRVFRVDQSASSVHVGAGMRLAELATRLHRAGLGLHTLPSLPHITTAGACLTATHGSGDAVTTLSSAVRSLKMVSSEGDLVTYRRGEWGFDGAVVSLGALGIVTELELDVLPTFDVEQYVYQELDWSGLVGNVENILASAYSVSVFVTWGGSNTIWAKRRVRDPAVDLAWTGAHPATSPRHPAAGMSARNCTVQGGVPGPWHQRLPHFRPEFTPSIGVELQSEYLVPRQRAASALRSLAEIAPSFAPLLHSTEIRSVEEDSFWLSPCFRRPSIAMHFTWIPDMDRVRSALLAVENRLSVHGARPHWAKLFRTSSEDIGRLYSHRDRFCQLRREADPKGKFGNDMIDSLLPI